MTQNPLIIHHLDSDGICGAMVLWLGLGKNAQLVGAQYGWHPLPDDAVRDRAVWIVDFSYPRDVMEHIYELASEMHVLDHHASAEKECDGLGYCTFDASRSGAKLAFDEMVTRGLLQQERPIVADLLGVLVAYVQDRDLWRWELDNSREMAAWYESFPATLDAWYGEVLKTMLQSGLNHPLIAGRAILRQNSKLIGAMAYQAEAAAYDLTGDPLKVLLVNAPVLHSEVADKLLTARECDFVCAWRRIKGRYVYNLRSTNVDVSQIAEAHGGGGHKQAAGFASPLAPTHFFKGV